MAPKKRINSGENSGEKDGRKLIPQPHGGALVSGGRKGQKGGTGRPLNVIRATMRQAFDERIPILQRIADDEEATVPDRLRALDMLAKYGLGTTPPTTDGPAPEPQRMTVTLVRRLISPDGTERVTPM
jgi:hypothetical protein